MSGGTPTGAGYMRQRHSQGYASSGDDLEDDACSVMRTSSPQSPKVWSRIEIFENVLWLASAAFIVYYGDRKSNLIHIFCHDERIRRYRFCLNCPQFCTAGYFACSFVRRVVPQACDK